MRLPWSGSTFPGPEHDNRVTLQTVNDLDTVAVSNEHR